MKVSELLQALRFANDDDEIEFVVDNDGPTYVAELVSARYTTAWEIPKRGELEPAPDSVPKTITLLLEASKAAKAAGDLS